MPFINYIIIIWTLFLSVTRSHDKVENHPIYFNNYHYKLKDILQDLEWSMNKQTDNETISCNKQIPLLCILVSTKQEIPTLKLTYDHNKLSFDFMSNDNWNKINILTEMNDSDVNMAEINTERRRLQRMRGIRGDFRELQDEVTSGITSAMDRKGLRGSSRRRRGSRRRRSRRRRRRRRPSRRHRFGRLLRGIRNGLCGAQRCQDGGFKNPCMNSRLSTYLDISLCI